MISSINFTSCVTEKSGYDDHIRANWATFVLYAKEFAKNPATLSSDAIFWRDRFLKDSQVAPGISKSVYGLFDGALGTGGLGGCDLIDMYYRGDPNSTKTWFIGYRDVFMNHTGYLYHSIGMGVILDSAVETL